MKIWWESGHRKQWKENTLTNTFPWQGNFPFVSIFFITSWSLNDYTHLLAHIDTIKVLDFYVGLERESFLNALNNILRCKLMPFTRIRRFFSNKVDHSIVQLHSLKLSAKYQIWGKKNFWVSTLKPSKSCNSKM